MEEDVISQAEAAKVLGVSRTRIGQMIDAGILPSVDRIVRGVRRSDVVALKGQERKPGWRKQQGEDNARPE